MSDENPEEIIEQIKQIHTEAQNKLGEINTFNSQSDQAFQQFDQIKEKAIATKTTLDNEKTEIIQLKDNILTHKNTTENFTKDIENLRQTNSDSLENLSDTENRVSELEKRVESLLPGATSAGLATSFKTKSDKLRWPKYVWGFIFIASIIVLIYLSINYFQPVTTVWKDLVAEFFRRLPIIGPMVWLAWFSARQYGHTVRLQELYDHKQTVSASFEGYKNEMQTLSKEGETNQPLEEFYKAVINVYSKDPQRIFDHRSSDESPLDRVFAKKAKNKNSNEA